MTTEKMRENMFIAKRMIDAIEHFGDLKIAYDEEKRVVLEALVRYADRLDCMRYVAEHPETEQRKESDKDDNS